MAPAAGVSVTRNTAFTGERARLFMVRTRTMLHDENYKRQFASPLMVQDVLRACLPAHPTGWPPPTSPTWASSPPSTSATNCARATATPSGCPALHAAPPWTASPDRAVLPVRGRSGMVS